MENDTYRELLMYENVHRAKRRGDNYMCDVYDSPRWQQVVGPLGERLDRIVLHACVFLSVENNASITGFQLPKGMGITRLCSKFCSTSSSIFMIKDVISISL